MQSWLSIWIFVINYTVMAFSENFCDINISILSSNLLGIQVIQIFYIDVSSISNQNFYNIKIVAFDF